MEHIPAIHAARVGMRCPALVAVVGVSWLKLDLDLTAVAPGRSPFLRAFLIYTKTFSAEIAREFSVGELIEVTLIEDVAGDGYASVSLPPDPAWLAWNGGTVPQLARRIRETGETVLLPVLADALEEAGCTDAVLLDHFRQPDPDGWRSWAVELLATQE
jgi:hypothetical protein